MFELSNDIINRIRIQFLVLGLVGILFLFLTFGFDPDFFPKLLIELFVTLTLFFIIANLSIILDIKKKAPLSLINNFVILLGIWLAFAFTLNPMLELVNVNLSKPESWIEYSIIYFLNFISLISSAYIFIILKNLFFQGKRKNGKKYFNAFVLFLLLAALASILDQYENLSFVKMVFTANAILLMIYSSANISWIAFLTKAQKKNLLLLSVAVIVFISLNLGAFLYSDNYSEILNNFSSSSQYFAILINIYAIIYFTFLLVTTLFHLPTAEAIDRKTIEISSLQYFSKLINQVLNFNELAETTTELALKISNSNSAWIIMIEGDKKNFFAPQNITLTNANKISDFVFSIKPEETIKEIFLTELSNSTNQKQATENFQSVAVAPFKMHNKIVGFLFVARNHDLPFDEEDKNSIQTFSDYATISFENSKLLSEKIEIERLERELAVAREMQKKILPNKLPQNNNFEVSAVFIPAYEVGGDYYDFFELSKNRLAFVIADASGKGISAAFIMAELRGIFQSLVAYFESPKEILMKTNLLLQRSLERKNFVTAIFGIIDFNNNTVLITRAGHTQALLINNDEIHELKPKGIGLGLNFTSLFDDSIEEIKLKMNDENILVLFTDGVTEAKNKVNEEYGIESLKKIIYENRNEEVDFINQKIVESISEFSKDSCQHDDITLLVIKFKKINGVN
ncbi:MAG: hypothetical protein C0425_11475 [Chlorobiaceae bacterium]|nr:hypothetical protein [Chlorobiaceae bacterium]MBA4310935.1 hypothetical protein [Chlorobiaceae bacterium]